MLIDLWVVLIPILLADVVNPVLFAFMVYAAGTARPFTNSSAVLLGHTVTYLSAGILLGFAFDAISDRIANPKPIDFGFGLLVGVVLLWVAWVSHSGNKQSSEPRVENLTPLKAFGFGAIINIIGLPFALPYFAAINQILKADLTLTHSILVVAGYNLAYALPFLLVPALVLALGERSRPMLERITQEVNRVGAYLVPWMLALVGAALVADAMRYFATGEGLW